MMVYWPHTFTWALSCSALHSVDERAISVTVHSRRRWRSSTAQCHVQQFPLSDSCLQKLIRRRASWQISTAECAVYVNFNESAYLVTMSVTFFTARRYASAVLAVKPIGTHVRSIEWCYFQWPWVTPNYPKPPHFQHFAVPFIFP